MPSPFAGMDPYIEHPDVWSDVHRVLAERVRGYLNARIRLTVCRPVDTPESGPVRALLGPHHGR